MNKNQIIGIGLILIGIASYFLLENDFIHVIGGVLCGIGVGLILKWIPFKKRNLN